MDIQVNTQSGLDPRLFLRDEELDRGVALILAGERALIKAGAKAQKATGLNAIQLSVMLAIRAAPGLSVMALREQLGATVPTMARVLGALDTRGLVNRDRSGADGRKRKLTLSDTGNALIDPVAAKLRDTLREAYKTAGSEHVIGARAVLEALSNV